MYITSCFGVPAESHNKILLKSLRCVPWCSLQPCIRKPSLCFLRDRFRKESGPLRFQARTSRFQGVCFRVAPVKVPPSLACSTLR